MVDNQKNFQFEKMKIHDDLYVVRLRNSNNIIGYINKHPQENAWFYFIKDFISPFFNSSDEAIEKLIIHFLDVKFTQFQAKQISNKISKK